MSNEYVQQSQSFAVTIEHILWKAFECQNGGFGGQVTADKIRKHPFLSMTQGLAYLYALLPTKKALIEDFIFRFSFYADMSIDELLSFETNERVIGSATIQIEKENGLEQLEYIIKEFRRVVDEFHK